MSTASVPPGVEAVAIDLTNLEWIRGIMPAGLREALRELNVKLGGGIMRDSSGKAYINRGLIAQTIDTLTEKKDSRQRLAELQLLHHLSRLLTKALWEDESELRCRFREIAGTCEDPKCLAPLIHVHEYLETRYCREAVICMECNYARYTDALTPPNGDGPWASS